MYPSGRLRAIAWLALRLQKSSESSEPPAQTQVESHTTAAVIGSQTMTRLLPVVVGGGDGVLTADEMAVRLATPLKYRDTLWG